MKNLKPLKAVGFFGREVAASQSETCRATYTLKPGTIRLLIHAILPQRKLRDNSKIHLLSIRKSQNCCFSKMKESEERADLG